MERNLPLLRKTMDFINEHPNNHSQQSWDNACGTSFCFAGHAALIAGAGYNLEKAGQGWWINKETGEHLSEQDIGLLESGYEHVSDYAQRVLGLDNAESSHLFSAARTKEELNDAVDLMEKGAEFDHDEWCFVLP